MILSELPVCMFCFFLAEMLQKRNLVGLNFYIFLNRGLFSAQINFDS